MADLAGEELAKLDQVSAVALDGVVAEMLFKPQVVEELSDQRRELLGEWCREWGGQLRCSYIPVAECEGPEPGITATRPAFPVALLWDDPRLTIGAKRWATDVAARDQSRITRENFWPSLTRVSAV